MQKIWMVLKRLSLKLEFLWGRWCFWEGTLSKHTAWHRRPQITWSTHLRQQTALLIYWPSRPVADSADTQAHWCFGAGLLVVLKVLGHWWTSMVFSELPSAASDVSVPLFSVHLTHTHGPINAELHTLEYHEKQCCLTLPNPSFAL